jgi:hypothetical protein
VEDRLKERTSVYSHTEGPELGHGRIETRTYRVFDGLDIIADKEKWGGNMKRLRRHLAYIPLKSACMSASTPALGSLVRNHWSIESMHWSLADDDSILLSVFMQLSNKYHLEN